MEYALSKIKSFASNKQDWQGAKQRLDYYFQISLAFMVFSFLFYSSVTWMINGKEDIHFAQFDKYGVMAEPLIDNIMYF